MFQHYTRWSEEVINTPRCYSAADSRLLIECLAVYVQKNSSSRLKMLLVCCFLYMEGVEKEQLPFQPEDTLNTRMWSLTGVPLIITFSCVWLGVNQGFCSSGHLFVFSLCYLQYAPRSMSQNCSGKLFFSVNCQKILLDFDGCKK